jgi:chemotaxis signal transduction protein
MSATTENLLAATDLQSFVLLRLGDRRFAVTANQIAELVAPSRIFRFPHHTAEVEGVILRRGRIVPVCDVAEKLLGAKLKSRRFYLIVQRRYDAQTEWVALPVTGDCELINTEMTLPSDSDGPHVSGWISHAGDVIEVLNLSVLTPGAALTSGPTELSAGSTAGTAPVAQQEARP